MHNCLPPRRILFFLFAAVWTTVWTTAPGSAHEGLRSGPMVGYSQALEVQLWLQTDGPKTVVVRYHPIDDADDVRETAPIRTERASAFTAKPLADEVEPGRRYAYEIVLDGELVELSRRLEFQTQVLWQRGRSEPPSFRIALGSCAFIEDPEYPPPGDSYGGGYEIFESIAERRPDVMLWLGDNVYLRAVDWHSRTGMLRRYSLDRSLPEMQKLLSATHHYAVWDDHDAGPNNTHRSQWNLDIAQEAFELFWANPSYGVPGVEGGLTTYFQWADVDFFLLDNRSHRTPNERLTEDTTILGEAQIRWLLDNLVQSKAPFKIVVMGGQLLNGAPVHETYMNIAPGERDRILRRLREEGVTGVVFISGDRHFTEVSRYGAWGYPPIYELTFSPLTSGVNRGAAEEPNPYRIDETLVTQRNFGWIEVSGPEDDRRLDVSSVDAAGNVLWSRTITEHELRIPLPERHRGSGLIPDPNKPWSELQP